MEEVNKNDDDDDDNVDGVYGYGCDSDCGDNNENDLCCENCNANCDTCAMGIDSSAESMDKKSTDKKSGSRQWEQE